MKQIKNVSASVRARLYELAKKEGIDFQVILTLYMQERLLHRLSKSIYFGKFVIKGGLLLFGIDFKLGRPTKDIDFLGKALPSDLDLIGEIFKKITSIKVEDDGVWFDPDSVITGNITEADKYEGVRVKLNGYLEKARVMLQIDIGFGDVVVPEIVEMDFPVILDSNETPVVKAYSLESVIAEKLEAAVKLSVLNSRMKDFYDIYTILTQKNFDGTVLYEAIKATFENRKTPFDRKTVVFREEFGGDDELNRRWNYFLRRIGNPELPDFHEIMRRTKTFLYPVYESLCEGKDFILRWVCASQEWTKFGE